MPGSVRALAGLPKQVVTGGMVLKWKVEGMNLLELWLSSGSGHDRQACLGEVGVVVALIRLCNLAVVAVKLLQARQTSWSQSLLACYGTATRQPSSMQHDSSHAAVKHSDRGFLPCDDQCNLCIRGCTGAQDWRTGLLAVAAD